MPQILQAGGLSGGRQGVMKERITDVRIVYWDTAYRGDHDAPRTFEKQVNDLIKEGYQPMPNSYHADKTAMSMIMIKTEMKVEMI